MLSLRSRDKHLDLFDFDSCNFYFHLLNPRFIKRTIEKLLPEKRYHRPWIHRPWTVRILLVQHEKL